MSMHVDQSLGRAITVRRRGRIGAVFMCIALAVAMSGCCLFRDRVHTPKGFTPLFNGRDLAGWRGLPADPPAVERMNETQRIDAQRAADVRMREHWSVIDGVLTFDGRGDSLCTARDFADFELLVDWRIPAGGDSGIYIRGNPQVQIWDNPVGSGGIYNNKRNPSTPLVVADKPVGQWNTFRITMVGDRITVHLNDALVVDDVQFENYWQRGQPLPASGSIELQAHGGPLEFRNIYIREIVRIDE